MVSWLQSTTSSLDALESYTVYVKRDSSGLLIWGYMRD